MSRVLSMLCFGLLVRFRGAGRVARHYALSGGISPGRREVQVSRSTHKFARLGVIASKGELGSVLIRLMMVINDMSLAMDAQRRWAEDPIEERKHRVRGAKIYFVRLQIAHIYEAMKIVEEIRKSPTLIKAVDRSGRRTRKAFDALVGYMGSSQYKDIMGRMRNKLTFHYDPKIAENALASLVAKYPDTTGSMSLGDEPHNWYFEPGDMVGDRAAVREIFKVPEGADVAAEADKIVMQLHGIVELFGGFAGSLIWENAR
jgi:hypothetical protein